MRAVFISYRRDDSEGQAGRLYDDLVRRFGGDAVFMDVAGIEPGFDFRKAIDQNVASCSVLLALMGPGWIDAKDDAGRRRLDNPMDFVRLETASALKRDIPVIPVLVHGAKMPAAEQLPEDLQPLAYRNGVELTHARWDTDVQVLIKALQRHLDDAPRRTTKSWRTLSWRTLVVAAGAALVIVMGVGYNSYERWKSSLQKVVTAKVDRVAIQKVAADREAAKDVAADKEAAKSPIPQPPAPKLVPNFAGTWEPIDTTYNGERKPASAEAKPITITQEGSLVHLGNRDLQITGDGRVGYKTFSAQDSQHPYGHTVESEAEAALVDTLTLKLEGSILVFETTFDYKKPYVNHKVGKDLRIMRYRRVDQKAEKTDKDKDKDKEVQTPTITKIFSPSGSFSQPVTISGSGFSGVNRVMFNSRLAQINSQSDTKLVVTAPPIPNVVPRTELGVLVCKPSGCSALTRFRFQP